MDRLTKREGKHTVRIGNEWRRHDRAWDKLAEYEDLEEQGLLLRLPCKVGDMVWAIDGDKPYAYKITGYSFGTAEEYIDEPYKEDEIIYYCADGNITGSFTASEIGEIVFLTKEEAEAALEKMKNE